MKSIELEDLLMIYSCIGKKIEMCKSPISDRRRQRESCAFSIVHKLHSIRGTRNEKIEKLFSNK